MMNQSGITSQYKIWKNCQKTLRKLKNNPEKNKIQVSLINSELRDLKEEIEDLIEQENKTKSRMK